MFGFVKDRKNIELKVVMGLLLDNNGIPITYELFPGNTIDQSTLKKAVANLKELYKLDRITILADRGLNSSQNLEYLCSEGHDFVISYTLKRSPETFKMLPFDQEDRQESIDEEAKEVHRGLWSNEDSFRFFKSDLKTRPFLCVVISIFSAISQCAISAFACCVTLSMYLALGKTTRKNFRQPGLWKQFINLWL